MRTYDMQARPYRPEIGRFLTEDRYEAAGADFNLQSDHLTGDSHAFAGGNQSTSSGTVTTTARDWVTNMSGSRATRRIFGEAANADGRSFANAFKHAYWNALMEAYALTFTHIGVGHVRHFAYLHERPDLESSDPELISAARLDLHNNGIGRGIARSLAEPDEESLCYAVLRYLRRYSVKVGRRAKKLGNRIAYQRGRRRKGREKHCSDEDLTDVGVFFEDGPI